MKINRLKWGVPLVVIALGACCYLVNFIPASCIYNVETSFKILPNSDAPLVQWLQEQPGVISHTVQIVRTGPVSANVNVMFMQSRNGWGYPAFPNLERECQKSGYEQPAGRFVDCKD